MGARAQALGDGDAQLDPLVRLGELKLLRVRVGANELAAFQTVSIMLLTALPPAPPTPNTTMRGFNSVVRGAESEIAMGLLFLQKLFAR
jgi:hypothetical protein